MTKLAREKGFALIELIIAMTILLIIIFSFTTLFTTSFSGIFGAGDRSEALFKAQEKIDREISSGLNDNNDELIVYFGSEHQITVDGEKKVIDHDYDNDERNITLMYFLPDVR